MKVEIIATNDENFTLNPQDSSEVPQKQEEVVETPQPPYNPVRPAPLYNKVESMKWL